MELLEWFFIIQFFGFIGIWLYKLYNIMSTGEEYDIKMVFITYIVGVIFWGIGFATTIINTDTVLTRVLFGFERPFLMLLTAFLIFELFFYLKIRTDTTIKEYNPKVDIPKSIYKYR